MLRLRRILECELEARAQPFASLPEALGWLAEARGSFVLEGVSGPGEALAVASAIVSSQGRVRVGLLRSAGRPPERYVGLATGPSSNAQTIFDGRHLHPLRPHRGSFPPRGAARAGACVVVGTSVVFLRSHVHLQRAADDGDPCVHEHSTRR